MLPHRFLVCWRLCLVALAIRQTSAQVSGDDYLGTFNDDDVDSTSKNNVDISPTITQDALQMLYKSTGGESNWRNTTGWADYSILDCSYFGVTCYPKDYVDQRRAGQVQAIDLTKNNLVGTLPCSIFTLPYLERLVVRGNPDLTVVLNDADNLGFEQANFLKVFDISSTSVKSLAGIGQASQLEELSITSLQLTGTIPSSIFRLTALKRLYANYNGFSGPLPSKIGKLTSLEALFLSGNDLSGQLPSTIGNLRQLTTLALGQNAFHGSLPTELNQLTNLETLAIHRLDNEEKGPGISYKLPSLANLAKISQIYMQNQQLTGTIPDDFIKSASQTDRIVVNLYSNNFAGSIPTSLTYKQRLNLFLGDNLIDSFAKDFCSEVPGWMDGDVGSLGCSAILCPPGSWAPKGRAGDGDSCAICGMAFMWGTSSCEADIAQGEAVNQRDVLTRFYDKLGGPYWTRSANWNTDTPVCAWEGIICTVDSKVSEIMLRRNGLTNVGSEVPWKELFTLPRLEILDLSSNAIAFDFDGIKAATNLRVLDLSDTGLISFKNIEQLASIDIVQLSIASNSIKGQLPDSIFAVTTLEELDLSRNELAGSLSENISSLVNLNRLDISDNQFTGQLPSQLGALTKLYDLQASGNQFSGVLPEQLNNLVNLQELAIERNKLTGSLPAFADLVQLTSLRLGENGIGGSLPATLLADTRRGKIELLLNDNRFVGEIPSEWNGRFSELFLDLSNNRISSIGTGICSQSEWMNGVVEKLDEVCDAILCPAGTYNEFGRMTNVDDACEECSEALYMGSKVCGGKSMGGEIDVLRDFFTSTHGNDWVSNEGWTTTDDYCSWFGISCDSSGRVTRITLDSNGLYGSVAPTVLKLSELMELNLAKNEVSLTLNGIGETNSLRILNLSRVGLDSLDGIAKASGLVELYADENALSGYFPKELLSLTNLEKLYLNYNMYQGRIPNEISALTKLQELSLFHNRFTGQLPAALGSLNNLRILGLSENDFVGTIPSELNSLANLELLAIQRKGGTDSSIKGNIGVDQGRREDTGPGLTGRVLSFSGLRNLRELYLGVNSLSGSLPVDFLDGIADKTSIIQVDLTSNNLDGTVPSSLSRFDQMALYVAGNEITGIADGVCRQTGWMNGDVGRMGCSAILCETGKYSKFGRMTNESPCSVCSDGNTAEFYGSFECLNATEQQAWNERDILIELYKSTGGASWENGGNWLNDDVSICDWYGIACNQDGTSVQGISLQHNGMVGEIPTAIYKLPKLNAIDFSDNDVKISFSGIAAASSLAYVNLDKTDLTSLQGIDAANGLLGLSAATNELHDVPFSVFNLISLQSLDLSDNTFDAYFPSDFGKLVNLKSFSCSRCGLVGTLPSEMGLLSALTTLRLDMNALNGFLPKSFKSLQDLSVLDLSYQLSNTDLADGQQSINSLQSQISVGFEGNLEIFDNLNRISELYLQNNRFAESIPSSFLQAANAASIQTVDLRRNRLTGTIPATLARFTKLNILLADNLIESIPESLCVLPWNEEELPKPSCDHILCDIGTVNGLGYAKNSIVCASCPGGANDSPYLGGTTCGPDLERDILDQLFLELNGDEWTRRDGWYGGADACTRFGVICDAKRLVVALDLHGNGLRGIVTPRLWLLSHMVELNLSDNLVELSLENISQLSALKSLKLSGTEMRSFDFIGGAVSLTSLHLENNLLSGRPPEGLYRLTELERLYLDHNQLSGIVPSSIGQLRKLEELYLSDNKFSGSLDSFQLVSNVRVLSLARNSFTGTIPKFFGYSPSLEVLNLESEGSDKGDVSGLTGPLPAFSSSPMLRELNLAANALSGTIPDNFISQANKQATIVVNLDNNNIIGSLPTSLAQFIDLRLSLANNFIDTVPEEICSMSNWMGGLVGSGCDAFLCLPGTYNTYGRRLPNMDCQPCGYRAAALYFGSTYCGAAFPQSLSQFEILSQFWEASNGLKWFDSSGWTTSPSVCDWFGITCGNDASGREIVTEINLANNNLQWEASSIIFHLPHLRALNIANNGVKLVLSDIYHAASLEAINFSRTQVTTLKGIGGAKKLKVLKSSQNAFYSMEVPAELFALSDLVELDLSNCGFVGGIDSRIGALSNLATLDAANNDLSGQLPDALFGLKRLKRLVLSGNNFVGSIPTTIEGSTSLELFTIDARERSTAGLSGALPSLAKLSNLKTLDVGSNSLTGSIPADFLASVQSSGATISVQLDGNLLTGQVPSSLSSIVSLNLNLAGNEIESVSPDLCGMANWWEGDVRRFGCDGLLCPAGTFSAIGRQSSDQENCQACPDAITQYLGQTSCPSIQRARNKEILERLFDSTGGRKWNRKEGWMDLDNICEWFGITCGGAGDVEVRAIDLGSNNLVGRLPSEIFELSGLESLSLYSNPIDVTFDGIEQASGLKSLQLDSVGLRSLQGVGKATSLLELIVRFNNFRGSLNDEIAQLTNLEHFYCGDSALTGRLPSFKTNRQLSALRLGGNSFTGPLPSFSLHRRLRTLDVSDNQLSGDIPDDFFALADPSKPIFLDLSDNELSGSLPESLLQFPTVTIFARDNRIEGMNSRLCTMENWNEGDVELYQCNGILCPPNTFAPKGRASEGEACIYCEDAPYFGSTRCPNAEYSAATARQHVGAVIVLIVASVSTWLTL